jgi:protein-S-isoprenylcysteine O-methyltransferase Ste14
MKLTLRVVIHSVVWLCVLGGLLFGGAGTVRWPAAWVYLAEVALASVVFGTWMIRNDPGLVEERLDLSLWRKQKVRDSVVAASFLVVYMAWHALMGIDAERLRWSSMPVWAQAAGAAAIAISYVVVLQVCKVNSFASAALRVQTERHHKVITTGPYAIVRHPMYAGALITFIGMPFLLGSWLGLIAIPLIVVVLVIRIYGEEALLRAELEGYEEYTRRVRWRLIPWVW